LLIIFWTIEENKFPFVWRMQLNTLFWKGSGGGGSWMLGLGSGVQWRLKKSKCKILKSFLAYVFHKVVLYLNLVFFEILFTSSMLAFVSKTFEKPLFDFFLIFRFQSTKVECCICFWYVNLKIVINFEICVKKMPFI